MYLYLRFKIWKPLAGSFKCMVYQKTRQQKSSVLVKHNFAHSNGRNIALFMCTLNLSSVLTHNGSTMVSVVKLKCQDTKAHQKSTETMAEMQQLKLWQPHTIHKSQFWLKCQTNFATNFAVIEMTHWLLCSLAHTYTHIYAHSGANKHSKTHIALMKRNIFETMLIANDANRSCIERSICNQIIRRNFYSPCTEKNILCYRTNINIQWSINKSPNS